VKSEQSAPLKAMPYKLGLSADLHRWRAFLAIAELRSLTRAALFLDCNQPALSRQINALERECGTRLFNRTGRGVELSEVGTRIIGQVRALLAAAEQLEHDIRSDALKPEGRVTLGTLPSIGMPLTRPLFKRLRERFPGVRLKILEGSSGQVEEWLADARIDIAILYRYGSSLPEQEASLAIVYSYLIGAHGDVLTAGDEVPLKALDRLPFILPSAPNGLRNSLDSIARQHHISIEPEIEADSLPLMKSVVAEERLYTVLPLHAVASEIKAGWLQASKIVDPTIQRTIAMAMAKSKGPPRAVSVVAAQIVEIVQEMGRSGLLQPSTNADPAGDMTGSA
jgi:LysR family transcriptional regulator, nitrogen assimilation regulatory protein